MKNRRFATDFKPKKKIEAPRIIPESHQLIAVNQLVSLIAQRCKPDYENAREFRNKVSNLFRYAITNGYVRDYGDQVVFGEAIAHAGRKRQYAAGLADLPILITGGVHCVLPALQAKATGTSLPLTVDECHKALIEATHRAVDLERRLAAAENRLAEQETFAETGRKMRRPKAR